VTARLTGNGAAAPGKAGFSAFFRCLCDGARLMVGQPNYDTYVAHVRATHPELEPMTRAEFFRNREAARFGGGGTGGFRCC
jgi:uncharacterized short protein YbdD (DUF466 family)